MATAGDILTRLNEKLNDLNATRWPNSEHFRAMTDAQNAILEARPDLFEVIEAFTPVAGVQQSVPADCYLLLEVIANVTASNVFVSPITKLKRSTLDRQRSGWMAMDANAITDHWMQEKRERKKFYVVPPQPTSSLGKYMIRFAQQPSDITDASDNLVPEASAVNAIYNFCMHRALEKDEKFSGSPRAQSYLEKFATFLGVKSSADNEAEADEAAREQA